MAEECRKRFRNDGEYGITTYIFELQYQSVNQSNKKLVVSEYSKYIIVDDDIKRKIHSKRLNPTLPHTVMIPEILNRLSLINSSKLVDVLN